MTPFLSRKERQRRVLEGTLTPEALSKKDILDLEQRVMSAILRKKSLIETDQIPVPDNKMLH